jgi:hypothetical protein
MFVTTTYTITSCKPTVTNCPIGKVTSEVLTTVTICPVGGSKTGTPSLVTTATVVPVTTSAASGKTSTLSTAAAHGTGSTGRPAGCSGAGCTVTVNSGAKTGASLALLALGVFAVLAF